MITSTTSTVWLDGLPVVIDESKTDSAHDLDGQSLVGWAWDRGAEWAADVEAEREACARIAEREDWACGDPTCASSSGMRRLRRR